MLDLDVLLPLDNQQLPTRPVDVNPSLTAKRRSLVPPSSLVLSVALDELQVQTPVITPLSGIVSVNSVQQVQHGTAYIYSLQIYFKKPIIFLYIEINSLISFFYC